MRCPKPHRSAPCIQRRRAASRSTALAILAGALLAACSAACSGASVKPGADAAPRVAPLAEGSLELGQTVPDETSLGDTRLDPADAVWLHLIRGARQQLDIAQFYIANKPGSRLDTVLAAIEAAAARGVAVRVLVDVKFAGRYPGSLARLARQRGVTVRQLDGARHLGGGVLHAKYFLVDRQVAWLGSQNFDWRALAHIHETGVRFRVPALVAGLQAVFERDWSLAGGASVPSAAAPSPPRYVSATYRGAPVQVALGVSPKGQLPAGAAWDLPELVRWIDGAARTVRVQLLSIHRHGRKGEDFPTLHAALQRAGARGVAVEVMVGHWSKSPRRAAELAALQRLPGVSVKFLTVPQHSSGFIPFARVIHSKLLIVDRRRAWVGTSNWGYGYFHTSRNVGMFVEGARFAEVLDDGFAALWRSPAAEAVVPGKRYPRPRVAR